MGALSRPSKAALAAGVPQRYQSWFGRSGRRYLFTCTDPRGLGDFGEGVAIVVSAGEITWAGEAAALDAAGPAARVDGAVFIHLLAATAEERRAAIDDLRPAEGSHLRLAA